MEAIHVRGASEKVKLLAGGALEAGDIVQLPDGRAGVVAGANDVASSAYCWAYADGVFEVAKTSGIVLLEGGRAFWDASANAVHFRRVDASVDFFLGTVVEDAASAATTCLVRLNVAPAPGISLTDPESDWTTASTNGLGVTAIPGGGAVLEFDAVAEAAMAALYSARSFDVSTDGIAEFVIDVADYGDDGALDISVGVANGTHATDFDSVTESCLIHMDGNNNAINAESDDGTTEVAATDTTANCTAGTPFEVWMDLRDLTDIQIYVEGVLVLGSTTFALDAATGPLFPIVHIEKTSNDTTAKVRVLRAEHRTIQKAG